MDAKTRRPLAPATLLLIALAAGIPVLVSPAAGNELLGAKSVEPPAPHPLAPVLKMAEEGYDRIGREVKDYTCRIIRRERHDGKLRGYEFLSAKIRHEQKNEAGTTPFSVYLHFDKPRKVAGREVLFLEGRNAGRLLVRRGGTRLAYVTTFLKPTSELAMQESRYPVTDIGIQRLIGRLAEVARADMRHGECNVQFFEGAKIGDRECTRILVEHPVRRKHFLYHRAIVFIDKQRQIPLAYASYTWPEQPGGKPVLMEEYIYADVELNVGLTDDDFDRANPSYAFLKKDTALAGN
ncbi:MAG: DUF1571 domain-containing protein [Planctomycetota bacterium]